MTTKQAYDKIHFHNKQFSVTTEKNDDLFSDDSDDAENLSKFFNLIAKFNKGKQINIDIRVRIEKHFEFKWNNDRNSVVSDKVAMEWMSQIPESTKVNIYQSFLFKNFIKQFQGFFIIFKEISYDD